ncbi:hypothetical protein [Streptomyces xinghaiensis]|uniref:hypothetical protein n=1 Tax=Streptomyces xinghaiensis TaxID=1038928 RepID=UPI002E157779|nr:hypothetical protein OG463_15355 [Streptomyces xinghaiensis]
MNISEAREVFYEASDMASDIARKLALAGIGVVWLVAGGLKASGVTLTREELWALILLTASLAMDLAQYLYKTIAWSIWAWWKENRAGQDGMCGAPSSINYPTWWFFTLKMLSMAAAYGFIIIDLIQRLNVL